MIPSMNSLRVTFPSPSVSARWKKSMIRDRLFFIHWRYCILHASKSKLRSRSIWTRRTQLVTTAIQHVNADITQYYKQQSRVITIAYWCFCLPLHLSSVMTLWYQIGFSCSSVKSWFILDPMYRTAAGILLLQKNTPLPQQFGKSICACK